MKINDIDFDVAFHVTDGMIAVDTSISTPTEVWLDTEKLGQANDLDISSDRWEPLTGYSNQDGYHGACLHNSEFVGGGLERDILENDGIYVMVCVYHYDTVSVPSENGYGAEPDGWAVLKMKEN